MAIFSSQSIGVLAGLGASFGCSVGGEDLGRDDGGLECLFITVHTLEMRSVCFMVLAAPVVNQAV